MAVMAQTPILGTGMLGLVGSKLMADFGATYDFQNLDINNSIQPVDITNYDQVAVALEKSAAQFVIHFAAFTDVTKAWEQRDDKNGVAYKVNVIGTENIARAAKQTGKHLIHISTAYVFNGENPDMYTEDDPMQPIEWYGQTKAWAEEKVMAAAGDWTILRIDQPFRSDPFAKVDLAHRIIAGLQNNSLYPQFTNHWFGPTYINDFVKVIDWVIRTQTTGLFHASSGEKWSDFEFATMVKDVLHLVGEVKTGDLESYLQTLSRPYQRNTALNCQKLTQQLDFSLTPIKQTILEIQL